MTAPSPRICLSMIVRNEAAIIERCLASAAPLIDAAVICDTGSSDDTAARAGTWLGAHGIGGRVFDDRWVDFGTNRTRLLEAARAYCDSLGWARAGVWWLLLDADHELVIEPGFGREALAADAILVRQRTAHAAWWNLRLARASVDWRVVGSTHERYEPLCAREAARLDSLWIRDHADGGSRSGKFPRDIELLTRELTRDPANSRALFYLAQSYGAIGDTIKALVLHEKRLRAGGNCEEIWHSQLAIGRLYASTGDATRAADAFLAAHHRDTARAEPLYELARLLRAGGRKNEAAAYAAQAAALPEPVRLMMVDEHVYRHAAAEELAHTAVGTAFHRSGADACEQLILSRATPSEVRAEARITALSYVRPLSGCRFLKLQPSADAPYRPCNPSILQAADGYVVNCRTVNYEQRRLHYRPLDVDGVFRTRNVLMTLDCNGSTLRQVDARLEEAPLRETRVRGLEDCRLFTWRNETWLTCATLDRHPAHGVRQSLCRLEPDGRLTHHRPLTGPFDEITQKNWLPFEADDGRMAAVYAYDPMTIVSIDPDTGAYSVATEAANPLDARPWRGSAGPIGWPARHGSRWLMLVHEAVHRDGPDGLRERVYTHRFVECDGAFGLLRVSPPFVFAHQGVEYVCGMAHAHEHDAVLIGLGIEDREAYLCRVSHERIEALLNESAATSMIRTACEPVVPESGTAPLVAMSAALCDRIAEVVPTLPGWATPAKAACLARLVLETGADISVEIGVFGGRGTMAMALAHLAQRRGYVAAIDPWAASPSLEGDNAPENDEWWRDVDYESVLRAFQDAVHRHGVATQVRIMRLRSEEAVDVFPEQSIAVLHQDGNHSEQVSSAEVIRWTPRLRRGGYWVADDCDWPTTANALRLLAERGFVLVADHGSWRVYRKP